MIDTTALDAHFGKAGHGTSTHVEAVTQKLREMIVSGQLAANTRIPERDIAETLGVSRTPVRVALGILEADGLVSGHPNRGFTVREFTVEDVLSAYDVRGVLEGFAVRTAIEEGNFGEDSVETLESCVLACEELLSLPGSPEDKIPRWSAANHTFHQTIIQASNRRTLVKVYAQMSRMPLVSPTNYLLTLNMGEAGLTGMRRAHEEHLPILDAIRKGQAGRAEDMMREHMYSVRERLAEIFRSEFPSGALMRASSDTVGLDE